jgi:hypothetical protein
MYFKIKWWQLIFYETAVFSLAALLATRWYLIFKDYTYLFIFLLFACGIYTILALKNQVFFDHEESSGEGQDAEEL